MAKVGKTGKLRLGALTLAALSTVSLAARAQDAPPPAPGAAPSVTPAPAPAGDAPPAPPAAQPAAPQPGPPGAPSPGQGYPPGYAPPGYAPGYAAPGYAPPAYAPPTPTEPTHTGTYVHLQLGGGFTSVSSSGAYVGNLKLSGGGPAFGVAVGGAPVPNLAVFGSLFFTGASQPRESGAGLSTQFDGDVLVGGFGAGVVYYFMPANVYLSGAIAALQLQADDANGKTTYTSDAGVGFDGMVGKEFWVSDHWGLGGALEFVAASAMKDKDNSAIKWSGAAFNLLFSATYF